MTPYKVGLPAPAKRLVLFVADGLRADKLYQFLSDENSAQSVLKAPFLKKIINEQGSWGISHTRVPTESRPGHVALIAGFYEDVSAVTKGWKTNPVEFDSVLNQSKHTWSFGSPDILPMFSEGASDPSRIDTIMYSSELENFAKDATQLDTWVFEKFRQLFENSTSNDSLREQLQDEEIIFFLHLLGLDTNGHAYGPHSKEYMRNIKVVDEGVKQVVEFMEKFYGDDGKTAYVLTSDHGMSNRGNHGDGHPDNTRTPLIAWGAGINKPNTTYLSGHDEISAEWNLNHLQRNDVLQADIAPLMASLIGIHYPVNSVGELPLKYLNNTPQFKAQSALVNAMQVSEQYLVKHDQKRQTELMFKPFFPLSNATHNPRTLILQIKMLIETEKYDDAEKLCLLLLDLSLKGLRYLQTYDWLFLQLIITAGFSGWIIYSFIFILKEYFLEDDHRSAKLRYRPNYLRILITYFAFLSLYLILFVQESPKTYYVYVFFPVAFWSEIIRQRHTLFQSWQFAVNGRSRLSVAGYLAGYIIALEVLVYSYFERSVLTACFVLAALWPATMPSNFRDVNGKLLVVWSGSCIVSSLFMLLPVEKGEDITLVNSGGLLLAATGFITLRHSKPFMKEEDTFSRRVIQFQIGLILSSTLLVYDTTSKLSQKLGLPVLNQLLGWLFLGISSITPFIYRFRGEQHFLLRLVNIVLAFAPLFVLLSISYEVLFYCFFSITLFLWLALERKMYRFEAPQSRGANTGAMRSLKINDIRIAVFFLFFIKVAFFGTGNVASLGSFSLQSVYRLTTVFDPFLMGALLIFKILIPFFIVSSVFTIVTKSIELPAISIFLLVLSTSDVMTLNFFYLVLLFPAYRSTDFEVHRNWLAITYSLPISKWYTEDTSEWTIDYPPFFAWFEWVLAQIAARILSDQEMLRVDNLNYVSRQTVYFQRGSVLVSELFLFFALEKFLETWRQSNPWQNFIIAASIFLNPGLIIGNDLASGILFAILLNFKHIFLYLAPAYFVYLLRHYCFQDAGKSAGSSRFLFKNFIVLGASVAITFAISFAPFIYLGQMGQVLSRLFPFTRGLCHAYWAPNFWALYSVADRALVFVGKGLGWKINEEALSSITRGLVGDVNFAILPNIQPNHTFVITLLFQISALVKLWRLPNFRNFMGSLIQCGFASFLFGWHVHEKAILLVLIPFSLIAGESHEHFHTFVILSLSGLVSLFPLLFQATESVIKISIFLIWIILTFFGLSHLIPR
ncbi:hypothetical protein G9A89_019834 [Geosiphon pyriformis]|nr:hypothetical protein G9A89_019834 [Geosiphon pyriformis]